MVIRIPSKARHFDNNKTIDRHKHNHISHSFSHNFTKTIQKTKIRVFFFKPTISNYPNLAQLALPLNNKCVNKKKLLKKKCQLPPQTKLWNTFYFILFFRGKGWTPEDDPKRPKLFFYDQPKNKRKRKWIEQFQNMGPWDQQR